jgi:hypothetical protein
MKSVGENRSCDMMGKDDNNQNRNNQSLHSSITFAEAMHSPKCLAADMTMKQI